MTHVGLRDQPIGGSTAELQPDVQAMIVEALRTVCPDAVGSDLDALMVDVDRLVGLERACLLIQVRLGHLDRRDTLAASV